MIIGLVGLINSGKGTVASHLVDNFNFRQESFASALKDAAAVLFDWPRYLLEGDTNESREWREIIDPWWSEKLNIPNFTPRYALQYLGTDILRTHFNSDIWFLTVQNKIRKNPNQHFVISDVRFPNEVNFIKENNGKLIRINRGPLPIWYDTALLANKGNTIAKEAMIKTYSSAHFSEWAWIGAEIDFQVNNNDTIENLKIQIDKILNKLV